MTIPIYIGIAAVLFITGIVFVLKGISAEEETAVPILNPSEIRELKETFAPPKKDGSGVTAPSADVGGEQFQGEQVMGENHQLRKEALEAKENYEQLKGRMEALQKEYTEVKEQKEETIRTLKNENVKIQTEREQISANDELLDDLKTKIEMLERQYTESQKQQEEMRTMVGQLRTEKDDLLAQTKQKDEQASAQIMTKTIMTNKAEFEMLSNKLIESISIIEELKRENKDLQKTNSNLSDRFRKTGELNDHLMKKEKMIQYELTKNRAQALGLEKICADFRTQIETMAGAATGNT